MPIRFLFNVKGEPKEWNPGAMYYYNGDINVIQGVHNTEERDYLRSIYNDTLPGSFESTYQAGKDGKDPGSLRYNSYSLSSGELAQIISGCMKSNILPTFGICILLHEGLWGSSSVAKADNNWGGMTWTGNPNRPSGVKVSVGQSRGNEGGNYMHYNTLQDFIIDWCYLLVHGGYQVAGKRDLGEAVRGMFVEGGARYNYAAAGYGSYWGAVSRIKQGLDAQNGGIDRFNNGEYGTSGSVTGGTMPPPKLKEYYWTSQAPVYRRIFGVLQPGAREKMIQDAINSIKQDIAKFIDIYGKPTWMVSQQQMWIRESPAKNAEIIGYTTVGSKYNILDSVTACDYHWAKVEVDVGDTLRESAFDIPVPNPSDKIVTNLDVQDLGCKSHIDTQQLRIGDLVHTRTDRYYRITEIQYGASIANRPYGSYSAQYCGDNFKPSTHKEIGWTPMGDILDQTYALFGR